MTALFAIALAKLSLLEFSALCEAFSKVRPACYRPPTVQSKIESSKCSLQQRCGTYFEQLGERVFGTLCLCQLLGDVLQIALLIIVFVKVILRHVGFAAVNLVSDQQALKRLYSSLQPQQHNKVAQHSSPRKARQVCAESRSRSLDCLLCHAACIGVCVD